MQISMENQPDLRELTRSFADQIKPKIDLALNATKHLYRPAAMLGKFVTGNQKDAPKNVEKNIEQFKLAFKDATSAKPFGISLPLNDTIDLEFAAFELQSLSYTHAVPTKTGDKVVTVMQPLKFVLSPRDILFPRLFEIARMKTPPIDELKAALLHYTAINFLLLRNETVLALFEALRYPISTTRCPELGALPITVISAPAGTVRPPDNVIAQTIHYSGSTVIEELVDIDAWSNLRDPMLAEFRGLAGDLVDHTNLAA